MVLLAINTTIVTTGIVVFLIVILILVGILLFAKAKLTAKGDVKISINNGDRIIQPNRAAHCCPPWQARKYSCLRPVVVKVPVVCVNAR